MCMLALECCAPMFVVRGMYAHIGSESSVSVLVLSSVCAHLGQRVVCLCWF